MIVVAAVLVAIWETGSFGSIALAGTFIVVLAWRSITRHSAILVLALVLLLAGAVFVASGAQQADDEQRFRRQPVDQLDSLRPQPELAVDPLAAGLGLAGPPPVRRRAQRRAVEEAGRPGHRLPPDSQRHAQLPHRTGPARIDRADRVVGRHLDAGRNRGVWPGCSSSASSWPASPVRRCTTGTSGCSSRSRSCSMRGEDRGPRPTRARSSRPRRLWRSRPRRTGGGAGAQRRRRRLRHGARAAAHAAVARARLPAGHRARRLRGDPRRQRLARPGRPRPAARVRRPPPLDPRRRGRVRRRRRRPTSGWPRLAAS